MNYEMAAVQKYSALRMMPFGLCPCYNSVMGSVLSDNVTIPVLVVHFEAHYSSKRFIQRPILLVVHVSSAVVGSPANSVAVF